LQNVERRFGNDLLHVLRRYPNGIQGKEKCFAFLCSGFHKRKGSQLPQGRLCVCFFRKAQPHLLNGQREACPRYSAFKNRKLQGFIVHFQNRSAAGVLYIRAFYPCLTEQRSAKLGRTGRAVHAEDAQRQAAHGFCAAFLSFRY